MKLVLLKDVKHLGKVGDEVNVKGGFARNYLLPSKSALTPSEENLEIISKMKDELMKKEKGFYRALAMVTDSKNADDDESKLDDDSKINVAITPKGDGKTYDDETKQKGMQPLEIEVESKNADDDESEQKESFCSKLCGGGKDKKKDENEPYVLSRSII